MQCIRSVAVPTEVARGGPCGAVFGSVDLYQGYALRWRISGPVGAAPVVASVHPKAIG